MPGRGFEKMTKSDRELNALNAYLSLLEKTGATTADLAQYKSLAQHLVPLLKSDPATGDAYRERVEQALTSLDTAKWASFLAMSREYYHFWIDDIKTIAAMHASGGYKVGLPTVSVPEANLKMLWASLDGEKFSVSETWPLRSYVSALREGGAEKGVVDTRSKLVKLLLVHLRDAEMNDDGRHYRAIVDSMLPMFEKAETRGLFLTVAREFFNFWIGNPDAPEHIVLQVPDPEIA